MGLIDRSVIRMAIAAQPQIADNLRELVGRLTGGAFAEHELHAIQEEVVGSLRLAEAQAMPSILPTHGQPLRLSCGQLSTMETIVGRFADAGLRDRVRIEIAAALAARRMLVA